MPRSAPSDKTASNSARRTPSAQDEVFGTHPSSRAPPGTAPADRPASAANVYPISRNPRRCRCSPVPDSSQADAGGLGAGQLVGGQFEAAGSNRNMRDYVLDPRHGRRLPDSRWPPSSRLPLAAGSTAGATATCPLRAIGRRASLPGGRPPPPPGSIVKHGNHRKDPTQFLISEQPRGQLAATGPTDLIPSSLRS